MQHPYLARLSKDQQDPRLPFKNSTFYSRHHRRKHPEIFIKIGRSLFIDLRLRGGKLLLKPPGAVEDLVELINANKLALVEHLSAEDRELTDYLVANIRSGGAYSRILPAVRSYLQRTLPAEMVHEIEEAFAEHVNRLER